MESPFCITLIVMTPESTLLEIQVSRVELPGAKGRFVVLRNHIPLISSLVEGYVVYSSADGESRLAIRRGFVEVNSNKVTVCAEV